VIRLVRPVVLLAFAVMISACTDNRARIIVDNQSDCPAIAISLTNSKNKAVITDRIGPGTKREYVVDPDVFYHYEFDYTVGGPTKDNYRCTAIKRGDVSVPAGTAQTFTLTSERVPPTPTPAK